MSAITPAILTQSEGFNTSEKYVPITTGDIIQHLGKYGFEVAKVDVGRIRNKAKEGYQKHVVRLRNTELWPESIDGLFPEIVIKNSYDTTTSFQLMFGIYRLVCSNGMVVGKQLADPYSIKHIGEKAENVEEYIDLFYNQSTKVYEAVNTMKQIQTVPDDRFDLVQTMLGKDCRDEDLDKVIDVELIGSKALRAADEGSDLWTVYNRIQEVMMLGLYNKKGTLTRNGVERDIIRKAKRITNLDKQIKANGALFDKALELVF